MKRVLSFFDVTGITVGSIVGADIYIASAISAGMVGPFALVIWAIAGMLATVLALVMGANSALVTSVGGPYAYATEAFSDYVGFLAGWTMWIAEMIALPVFAISFTNYLQYFVGLNQSEEILIRVAFLMIITGVNILGVKAAGRINDVLTVLKLAPLVVLIVVGLVYLGLHPHLIKTNYTPFLPLGIGNVPAAIVLIFWAYVGFELTTIPSTEIRDPAKTIPRAIAVGIAFVAVFYLLTNFVVFGTVNWETLATSATPLVASGTVLFGSAGAVIMGIGALISVSGSDESDMLASSRLAYAMSADGLLPKVFSRVHPKFATPYVALGIQGLLAAFMSAFSSIPKLISFSVFNLGFCFLVSSASLFVLNRKRLGRGRIKLLATAGVLVSLFLIIATSTQDKIIGISLLVIGSAVYVRFSPKVDMPYVKAMLISDTEILRRGLEKRERFLGKAIKFVQSALNHFFDEDW